MYKMITPINDFLDFAQEGGKKRTKHQQTGKKRRRKTHKKTRKHRKKSRKHRKRH
jgi:hypothetical protein